MCEYEYYVSVRTYLDTCRYMKVVSYLCVRMLYVSIPTNRQTQTDGQNAKRERQSL